MTCIWTFEQMPGDTTAFLINEFIEYNELTQLNEFKFYDRYQQHWFEVKDGCMTVGYDVEGTVIYLYRGKLDGSEGDITSEYLSIRQENYPTQDNHTLTGIAHANMRKVVANLMFRAKDAWNERIVWRCDHETSTTVNKEGVRLGIGYEHPDCKLFPAYDYPLQCQIVVDGNHYLLDPRWGDSFAINRILNPEENFPKYERVTELVIPPGHSVLKFINVVEEDDDE